MNFEEVYEEFQPKIRRYLRRFVGPDEADDLAQDVFVKVSQALPEFRNESTLSTWIYRIATNRALDRVRGLSARRPSDRPLEDANRATDGSPDAERGVFRREMRDCLDHLIGKLPASHRTVFLLSEEEGLTNPEIADALGVSLHTVKIRLHRARLRLRLELGRRCHFSRDARNELLCEPKRPPVSSHD